MRALVIAVLLTTLVSLARADVDVIVSPMPPPPRALRDRDKSRSMKRNGMVSTIFGVLQLVVALAVGVDGWRNQDHCEGDECFHDDNASSEVAVGATFFGLSAVAVSAGIPMWIYGAREVEEARRAVALSGGPGGFTLRF